MSAEHAIMKIGGRDANVQWGIPDWIIKNLGLPNTTQRVVIVASNKDFMLVSAKFYAKEGGK